MPSATFFTQATDLKFSFMLLGWSTGTGEASSSLKALLMTYNRDKGYGTANRGRYSNAKVDALTEDALQTVDDVKREALPAARDRARDQRHRHRPAAFPGQPVGDARRHHATCRASTRTRWPGSSGRRAGQHERSASHCRRSRRRPQHFIGNRWVAPATGATLPMIDPSDGQPFATIAAGDARRTSMLRSRRRGARFDGAWGRLAPAEKGRLLAKLARAILDHADELALIEARDCGKPLAQARADVAACARYFEFYGGACDKLTGETIPYPASYHGADVARAARRHRPHHPVELSVADLRALGRRRARRRQRVRRQAGGGCVPVAAARRGARRRSRACPTARSTSSPDSGARPARRSRRTPGSITSRSPGRRRPAPGSPAKRRSDIARSRWSSAARAPQIVFADADLDAALPVHRQRDRPERRADVLRGQPARRRAVALRGSCWRSSARALPRSRSARRSPISIADR